MSAASCASVRYDGDTPGSAFAPLPTRRKRRFVLAGALVIGGLVSATGVRAAASDDNAIVATDLIDRTGKRVINILAEGGGPDAEIIKARRIARILLQSSDPRVITPLVVGKHWRSMDAETRLTLIDEIGRYMTLAIGNKLKSYSLKNERLNIIGATPLNKRDVMVMTEVLTDNYEPFRLDFRVRRVEERPIIIDIVVEGISMILTYRNEFDAAISRNGLDGFLARLREQTAS